MVEKRCVSRTHNGDQIKANVDRSVLHPLQQLYNAPLIDPSRLIRDEAQIAAAVPILMQTHADIKPVLEKARANKLLGSSLQCSVVLEIQDESALAVLTEYADELEAMFVVSSVGINTEIPEKPEWHLKHDFAHGVIHVLPPNQAKCPRCWRYVAPAEDRLCGRCEEVIFEV